jgi:hypothetical protein
VAANRHIFCKICLKCEAIPSYIDDEPITKVANKSTWKQKNPKSERISLHGYRATPFQEKIRQMRLRSLPPSE